MAAHPLAWEESVRWARIGIVAHMAQRYPSILRTTTSHSIELAGDYIEAIGCILHPECDSALSVWRHIASAIRFWPPGTRQDAINAIGNLALLLRKRSFSTQSDFEDRDIVNAMAADTWTLGGGASGTHDALA